MNNEEWRPIVLVCFPSAEKNYSVSSIGRIRREKDGSGPAKSGRILKPRYSSDGYARIKLAESGKEKRFQISRLVASAFIPNPENKATVNHKNGVRDDNRVENLEWATQSENNYHSFQSLGRKSPRGEEQGLSKLTEQDVREIRAWWKTGDVTQTALGARWGIDPSQVANIVKRRHWRHVA